MVAAMLPSNGKVLKATWDRRIFWPIYEEAEKLGVRCGACGCSTIWYDTIGIIICPALGHPFGIMAQVAVVVLRSIPIASQTRVGFSRRRGDVVPFFMDGWIVLSHHLQVDVDWRVSADSSDVTASEYRRHVKAGRILSGFDCDDRAWALP